MGAPPRVRPRQPPYQGRRLHFAGGVVIRHVLQEEQNPPGLATRRASQGISEQQEFREVSPRQNGRQPRLLSVTLCASHSSGSKRRPRKS